MRKTVGLIGLLAAGALLGCNKGGGAKGGDGKGDNSPGKGDAPAVKLAKLDLSPAGLPLTIEAPAGAQAKESLGDVKVTAKDFELIIHKGKTDLAATKKEVQGNDVARLKKLIVDEPDTLFYEAEGLGRSRFSIEMNVKAGDQVYYIRDGRSPYSKEDVELMMKCAKTLAPK